MIPKILHEHINTAFPANVCLVGSVLPDGYAQISPRGSTMVYDDQHLALWERGKGSTHALLKDGIARFYGSARLHRSGEVYDRVWQKLIQPEKDRDPEKKGFAVLIRVERVEDLDGQPLSL